MAAALGVGRFAYTPLLPEMTLAFGWNYAQAGDVASANYFGYLVGAILAPRLSYARHVRVWAGLSLMASVATTYLGAWATSYPAWLGVRFAAGVASACCLVVVTTLLMQTLHQERGERFGNVHFAGVGIGIVVCTLLVFQGGVVADQWARLGGLSAVLMVLAWALLRSGPWPRVQPADAGTAQREPLPWRVIGGYGLFGFSYIISATFVVAMAEALETPAMPMDARSVWIVVGLATIVSVYLWQWLANARGMLFALALSYFVLAAGVFLGGWADQLWLLLTACVLLGGTFGGITALGLSAARLLAPGRAALTVSTMTIAFSVGQLLGPAVAGRMADAWGDFFWPSALGALFMVLAGLLVPRGSQHSAV